MDYEYIIIICYFIPTMIAILRKHKSVWAIALVNLTIGWFYGIGVAIALLWSLTGDVKEKNA